MKDQLSMFAKATLPDTSSATSSPASADGHTRSASQAGRTRKPSGQGAVPVSRFRAQDSEKAMPINDISGPLFNASSQSARLQSCLENRLRERMGVSGSLEYALIWRQWDMPAGPPICALRVSEPLISAREYIGWPTPTCPVKTNGHQAGNNRYVTKMQSIIGGRLNPALVLWKMGFPPAWERCAGPATQ